MRSPRIFRVFSETSPESASLSALRRKETWLTVGFSVSSGKVVMPSTAFLISARALSTG
jgi:hypothetical protein